MGLFDWLFGKKPEKETRPTLSASASQSWKAGDRVLAKWLDPFFYPGRIRQMQGERAQVFFDDGDVAWVHVAHLLAPDIAVGSRVFARMQGGPLYAPAIVRKQNGEKIQLHYDHGVEEWTTISFVRVSRPIANAGEEPSPGLAPPGEPMKLALDLGDPVEDGDWRVGDRALARWLDFYWYPGTILALGSKGFQVLYDDGDQRVVTHQHLMPLTVEEGEQVFIRPKSEPQKIYTPAQVTRASGETLDVEFEDGTRESNTRVSRARFWRCPVRVRNFAFEEGDRVLAYDCDNFIYPAEIVSIQEDRVVVHYLDGPERMLTPELIRGFEVRAGVKVQCRWKGGPQYFPGVLAKVEGERIFIRYDDGEEEWNSVRLVRMAAEHA